MGENRHEAVDGLLNLLSKANRDLSMVHHKLEKEFLQLYPDSANPMKLVARIKIVLDEIASLQDQCRQLLAAKQDLIDRARTTLTGNRNLLQRIQAFVGTPLTSDANNTTYSNFYEIIEEWTAQVRSRTGGLMQDTKSEDINQLLFSAMVQGN